MAATYSSLSIKGESEEEAEVLLMESRPATVRIDPYIPAKKRTVVFDICVLVGVLVVFSIIVGIVAYLKLHVYVQSNGKASQPEDTQTHPGWIKSYNDVGSESMMRLIDVNGDGAQDLVFGVAQPAQHVTVISQPKYCQQYSDGCLGSIVALDGKSGHLLWNISTYNEVFLLNCGNIDINKDGKMDCIAAGRRGSYVAFDPHNNGRLLWQPQTGQESFVEYDWNFYNPLVVDDVNKDGVKEVFLSHGGDPDFPPQNHSRYPGRLILMNGADGRKIGRYIDMPDGKETYNSPILHTDKSGETYVLIGTGGETIGGSLLIVRLKDLVTKAKSKSGTKTAVQPIKSLQRVKPDGIFFEILRSVNKGVMVPVVLADIDHDGCDDLIVSGFDGALSLFNGDTFKQIWSFSEKNAESYTTPGIGYFNNDKTLDIMVHWNYGEWPDYFRSQVTVHSGVDGKVLWGFNTSRFSMTSDLVIRTNKPYQDLFVFRVQGRSGVPFDDGIGVIHGVEPQRDLIRNVTEKPRLKRGVLSCDLAKEKIDNLASEVFAVDWESRESPKRVFRRDVDKYYYNAAEVAMLSQGLASYTPTSKHMDSCGIMEQSSRTTGAVGDVNNDNKIDLVLTYNAQVIVRAQNLNRFKEKSGLDVVVVELEQNYGSYPSFINNAEAVQTEKTNPIKFKPLKDQKWTGYMGYNTLSKYNANN